MTTIKYQSNVCSELLISNDEVMFQIENLVVSIIVKAEIIVQTFIKDV